MLIGLGIVAGCLIGLVVGVLADNIPLWLGTGAALGAAVANMLRRDG